MLTFTGPPTSCLTRRLAATPWMVSGRLIESSPSEKLAPLFKIISGVSFIAMSLPPQWISIVERIRARSSKLDSELFS